jgi:phosphatidyl-myo-inositol dimannoside synthase
MAYILLAGDFPPSVGGIQTYHSSLARALVALGRPVHVIATEQPGAAEYDRTCPHPVLRVSTAGGKLPTARRMREAALALAGSLSQPLRGIVATKWSPEGPAADRAAAALHVPWGVFGHDREFILHGANLLKWAVQTYCLRRADVCFAISHYAAGNFRRGGAPANRIRMVGCGIEANDYLPDADRATALREALNLGDRPAILTVARLVPRKGHLTVLEALPQVIATCGPVAYLISGDGEHEPVLREAVSRLGLQDTVHFLGRTPHEDLRGLYTLAAVMVMPSYDLPGKPTEGFGLTFLEANCCGTAVIGSRTGGIPDAIAEGVTGLLVPPRDPAAVAEALIELLSNPARARQMGLAGQRRARERFRWDLVAQRVDEAFTEAGSKIRGQSQ